MPRYFPPAVRQQIEDFSYKRAVPTMSWDVRNTYNAWQRTSSLSPRVREADFNRSTSSLYQQRWIAKRLLLGYHAPQIRRAKLQRWYIPSKIPVINSASENKNLERAQSLARMVEGRERAGGRTMDAKMEKRKAWEAQSPVNSLLWRETERRIDTLIYRACFANSIRMAGQLVNRGHVKVNGQRVINASTLLEPGDIYTINPSAINLLSKKLADVRKAEMSSELAAAIDGESAPASEGESSTSKDASAEGAEASSETPAAETAPSEESSDATADASSSASEATPSPSSESSTESSASTTVTPAAPSSKWNLSSAPAEPKSYFTLPHYASPHIFVPAYILPNYRTCSAVYVRHPTARPGYSEIPSPYDASGVLHRMAWEWYKPRVPRVVGSRTKVYMDPQRTKERPMIARRIEERA